MAEDIIPAQSNDTVGAESNVGGEPQGSAEVGESGGTSSANREPEVGLFDGMDAPTLHKSYKSLQGQFTKVNEQIKELEKYGGPSQMKQWAEYLSNNPNFAEWVKAEQAKNVLGVNEDEMTEEQIRAMGLVRKMASIESKNQIERMVAEKILPLSEAYKNQLLNSHFKVMDEKYGKDWVEFKDVMSELSEELPDSKKDNPTVEDVEDLLFKAMRKSGKMEAFQAKQYERKLAAKSKKSTGRDVAIAGVAPKQALSIQEAFEAAKAAMGQ
jgi:hypothetical protein